VSSEGLKSLCQGGEDETNNEEQVIEIGLFWLMMAPPPGPVGSLTEMMLHLYCTDVTHAGPVRIHKLQNNDSWTIDVDTLNYTNMPTYDNDYFAIFEVTSEGMYTIDLLVDGGFSGYTIGGIAVIVDSGVRLTFSASEFEDESRRPLVRLSGESSVTVQFSLVEYAFLGYLNPILWIPLGIGIALLSHIALKRIKTRPQSAKAPF
jgi:hypothetical protein